MPRLTAKRPAAIALITILMVAVFALATITTVSMFSIGDLQMAGAETTSEQVFQAAEGGIQDALYKLGRNINQPDYSTTINGTNVDITIDRTTNPKTVTSQATGLNKTIRKVRVGYHASDFGGLDGALIGNGTINLGNNEKIEGDVCTNGSINGSNGLTIAGNITVAGAGHSLDTATVMGSVKADRVLNVAATGSISFGTSSAGSTTRTNATDPYQNCPNTSCQATFNVATTQCKFPPIPPRLFAEPLEADYSPTSTDQFYNQALVGGTTAGFTVSGTTQKIGPKVVTGNINFNNNATLTLTGPVWVTGEITSANNTTLQMDTTPGVFASDISTFIIAHDSIGSGNKTAFRGIEAQHSFLLVGSKTSNISLSNNGHTAVYYAPNGSIDNGNCNIATLPPEAHGVCLSNATANTLNLGNNTVIKFDGALRDLIFLGGSSEKQITVDPNSWSEQ